MVNSPPSWIFPRALDNFVLGILFAIIYMKRTERNSLCNKASILAPLGALLLFLIFVTYAWLEWKYSIVRIDYWYRFEVIRFLPAIATFLLLFSVFLPSSSTLCRTLTWAPLMLIGLVSYEWYLFHSLAGELHDYIGQASGHVSVYLANTLLPLVGTFLLSVFIYFGFSNPILAWTKARLRK